MIKYGSPKKPLKASFRGPSVKMLEKCYEYKQIRPRSSAKDNAKEVNTENLGQKVAELGTAWI